MMSRSLHDFPLIVGAAAALATIGLMAGLAFRGFEDRDTNTSLRIVEIPPQAYPEVEREFTTANLKKQGMTEEKRETVTLAGGNGVLIVGEQEADNKKLR